MTDDIVARLRSTGGLDARLLREAADEIERLRAELDRANENADRNLHRALGAETTSIALKARCNSLTHKLQELEVRDV